MSFMLVKRAIAIPDLKAMDKMVLISIADHADQHGNNSFPSIKRKQDAVEEQSLILLPTLNALDTW